LRFWFSRIEAGRNEAGTTSPLIIPIPVTVLYAIKSRIKRIITSYLVNNPTIFCITPEVSEGPALLCPALVS
jgi:hypothetical protein